MIRLLTTIAFLGLLGGCAVSQPPEPPVLANTARDQIGHLAVRGPTQPKVTLADDLEGKGAAAGKTALAAGSGWLGGSMEAAAQSAGEGGVVLLAFGLLTTPIVAAGGAAYGAAVADNPEAVADGNEVISQTLDIAPTRLRKALDDTLQTAAPVSYEFVSASTTDQALLDAGFDSVLDVRMQSIASRPTSDRIHVYFETVNEIQLRNLRTNELLSSRTHRHSLEPRAVSGWANRNATPLTTALDERFLDISGKTIEELFLAPAIRIEGMEPVSRGVFGVGTIPGLRPLFVWSALDGGTTRPEGDVDYEILISQGSSQKPLTYRTRSMRFVPADPLEACRIYRWQVRAHYQSFGRPTTTDWTPEYRFRTACDD